MNNPPNHGRTKGFALVTTLALMILLVVVAVGLLSLATISLRATSQENERANARANARLGLMLAIAQLQKNLGPDQRISAPANVSGVTVPASHENWTGAWKSDASSPSSFPAGRKDRFATWLVSQAPSATLDSVTSQSGASMVMERLSDGRETRAPLLGVDGGNLAWWTADEAQKATVDLADIVAGTDSEQIANRHQSPRLSPETIKSIGTFPKDAATVARLITPGQIRLAGVPVVPGQNRSLTVGARSVLADVQLGGLKRDFSSLLEMPEADISGYGKWSGANSINDPSSYIYGPQAVAFGARWNQLHSYYNLYKDVTVVNNEPRIQLSSQPLIDWNLADKQTDFGDKLGGFRYPRISRILYVFSYSAVPPSGIIASK